jgi:hypothetical protein
MDAIKPYRGYELSLHPATSTSAFAVFLPYSGVLAPIPPATQGVTRPSMLRRLPGSSFEHVVKLCRCHG